MHSLDMIDYKELYEHSRKENILLREEFMQLRLVNEQLFHRLEQLLKLSFGSKSERYPRPWRLLSSVAPTAYTSDPFVPTADGHDDEEDSDGDDFIVDEIDAQEIYGR